MKFKHLLLFLALAATPLRADVVTLGAAQDTMIQSGFPDNADGGGAGLFVGTNGNGAPHRSLISFDLSGIPTGAVITSVQLTLTLGQTAGQGGGGGSPADGATISLYQVTRNWGEGNAGNNTVSLGLGASGGGFAAAPGDATWNSAANGQTLWSTMGGDHAATASDTLQLSGNGDGTPYTWLSTPRMVADVQGWLNNSATNFGWELINADETSLRTFYAFYSSEWHTFPGGSAGEEPALQVTFTVPEPGAGALEIGAALVLFSLRPRRRRT